MGDWTIKDETTTREGKPAVTLSKIYVQDRTNGKPYTKEYADKNEIKYDNEFTVEHILPINELKPIQPEVSSKTQAPKFVRDISALITPATVRGFSPLTKRIKKLSLNYDKLVKQYAKKKDPKVLDKIKIAENQILNDAKQEIIDAVAKVDGVSVQFKDTKRGLWDNKFEPSFNMILSVTPQADTKKVSDLLFDFAEKYSQDAFILESESEFEEDVFNDKREMPLTEFDENNLMHYPQIIYTFAEPITDEQVAELSVALENEGIDAFNINNNELQVSVIKFLSEDEQNNLTNDEQYEERTRDFDSKAVATAKATSDVLGSDGKGTSSIRIKKSSYQGATNEGTADQTRQFNRSDIFEAFKGSTTKVETLAVELADLRQKEIDLQKEGKKLSPEDQARFNELNKKVQPVVQRTFEANKKLYEDAKTEVERVAQDAIADVDASISPFPIKRAERASVKAIRWYNAFTEKLGDAARVNIVVDTDANADKVFEIIDKKYPGDKEVRRITETTDLGYPKRLIEIRTSNGTIAEIQVITNEAYLAKDGIKGFTGDQKQKSKAKQKLDAVRARLGWNIPDGLGHYFYEIQRDTNVDEDLRDEAARLSDLYYDAFTNPKSALTESFMKDVKAFKKNVDAANKSQWDAGNTGKAPQSLIDYKPTKAPVTTEIEAEVFEPITSNDVKIDSFTRDNALTYEEDERETDSGRMSTYLSSVTVEATNPDGDAIGTITKITDEDKIFYFTVEDAEGSELNLDGYDTLGEAKKALADSYNKIQKKEFDKAAKDKAKAKAKKAKTEAKKPQAKKTEAAPKAEPIVEEEPLTEDLSSIDALLDLDVDNEDNMLTVLNALDNLDKKINKRLFGGANESLLAIPLGTVQLVVKTLKALVKGGMKLRDAIKKVAADNNLSQDIIKDIINISPLQEDFNALMSKVDELIARQKRRGIEDAKIVRNLDTFIRNSEAYKNANDAQKKIMEREGRIKMGVEQRRAPSIGRILGVLKDITNVSRKDKLKIISQIRQLSKDAAKDLAKEIRDLASTGKITVNQAANIIARFGKVNMLSEISVSSFVNYMTNVFSDAEYASKLSSAKSLKSSIASLSKNKEKNADLRELAKQFIEIDPSMVDDIDAYNDMASKIKEAISGSSIKSPNVNLARTVDIESSLEYISKTLEAQDKLMREVKAAEIQQLMGIDVSEFSYDDMVELLKKDKPTTKYNEGIVRSTINKMFNVFSAMISENIKNNEDPITGEKIDYTKEEKRIITEFMDMDLSLLEPKQALEAVDALANFLQNKSTAKMGAMLAEYKGIVGTQTAVKKNLKAQTLKKYGLEWLGKLFAENTTNLNVLFERMFKGFSKGNMIQNLMGIKDVINNKAAAQKESSNKVEDYVQKFYKKLANGEAFNTAYNNVERGISSFMQRTIIGSESQRREFFNTRKKLVKQSIEVLSQGNDKEKEKAKLYQQAYDKLIGQTKGPNENQILENEAGSIEDIRRRTDATNLDAINYWQNSWSEKYDQLYNTALNIYNKVLGRDINYTPDRYSKLSSDTGQVELANDQSAFLNNNDVLYQKEAGVLMETTRPDSLPKGKYLDFAFDNNNSNSYYEALVDMATAEPIRQVQGFLNSPLYKKVVPNSDDATILKDRIQLFINNFRNKNPYDNDEFSKFVRSLNVLAEIGASMALGGVTQPIKQVVPVAVNTLINAGGLDLSAPFDKAKNDFMSNSGYAIGNRGVESEAQVQSMNKLVEEAAKSSPQKLFNLLKKGNQLYLKLFLVNADAYIARASWMTYYEKYLNDKGVNTKGIDYNTHKLNKDAADYAQSMVDRQQNVSDADLSGKIFASKAPAVQLLVKTVMPFASFRMNQASRVGSDIAVVTDKTATEEDKTIAIRSLMGYAAETVTFRLISGYIAYQLGTAALKLLDREESEEEKEKRKNNLIKGQVTGTVTDVLSPAPIADKFVQSKVNDLVGAVQTGMNIPLEKQYNIFGESKQDYVQNMGMYGIASERASQLFELSQLAATGKYTDDFGKEKTISEKDQETLKPFIGLGFLSSIGLAPSETGSILRYMVKNVKKSPGKTAEEIEATEERLEEKQENTEQKIEALQNLRKRTRFKKQLNVIEEKINELEATPEEKKVIQQENKEERQRKKELLTDPETGVKYDNETELKRYNPRLYNKNFGLRSQWFKDHKDEKQVEQKLGKELRKMEDKQYKYVRRNSDGSLKRTGN